MSYSFYFEDGQGNVMDEDGNDPMDITGNDDPYKLEELASYSAWQEQTRFQSWVLYQGIITNHYLRFIDDILEEMDTYPEMKGHYLLMDNAPIHTSKLIRVAIESCGEFILKKDTLPAKIGDACNGVLPSSFEGFARYSVRRFDDYLNCLPI
ncbi:hypothetical protein MFLAVUS_004336 [Mucor flavus]|uniref:Tc1-like transposase DDE domain-containing protein n=1 Tax=Mucor flavus TaxID=439312 RepID=A0ABP9YVL5_9FUNG